MNTKQFKNFGLGLGALLLQILAFRHLTILGVQPDIIIIFLVGHMSSNSRTSSLLMAALLGFGQDFFLDLWGLNMFSKTLVVYLGHRFVTKNQKVRLSTRQVFITVLLVAMLHNIIFQGTNTLLNFSGELSFWKNLLGNSFYTATLASFIYLFKTNN